MYNWQAKRYAQHFETVEDNLVPYLVPFLGTGVLCSAFGSKVEFIDKMDPAHTGTIINDVDDLAKLKLPNMETDGLMPLVTKYLKYFKANSNMPIGITDCQGPLTTALQMCGHDTLFWWMYDCPEKVHEIMELVTEALIRWIRYQKEIIGAPMNWCYGNQGVYVPEGVGVWLADDDAIILSPAHYKEFVIPYNERILEAFGGGIVHWCGCANQHIENINKMKNLRGINNFSLADAKSLYDLRVGLNKDIVIVACDYTPSDPAEYYKTLFEDLKIPRQGIIFESFFSPIIGLNDKKYVKLRREESDTLPLLKEIFQKYSNL